MASLKDILEMKDLVDNAEMFKPIADSAMKAIKLYAPYLGEIVDGFNDYMIKKTIENIETFQKNGFTREEAIILTLDIKLGMKEACERNNRKKE